MVEHLEIRNFTPISFEDRTITFKTSLDIIQEVMNVPMCALTSLLRANGYDDIEDTTSLCIDEKGLEIFAEAYIRNLEKTSSYVWCEKLTDVFLSGSLRDAGFFLTVRQIKS